MLIDNSFKLFISQFIKIIIIEVNKISIVSFTLINSLNKISLDAKLVTYINKTINPPINTKNKINENQLVWIINIKIIHNINVWQIIFKIMIIGFLARVNIKERLIDK